MKISLFGRRLSELPVFHRWTVLAPFGFSSSPERAAALGTAAPIYTPGDKKQNPTKR